jgi:hypothetical protein
MSEQKELEEKMIQINEDEASSVKEGMIKEPAMESSENEEDMIEDENEAVEGSVEYSPLSGETKKHSKAKSLIQKSKKIVEEATKRIDACRLLLEMDLKAYEEAKSALCQGGLDQCVFLVKQLEYHKTDEEEEKSTVTFKTPKAFKPMLVKDVSSGRVTGMFYALFGGVATAIGMVYLATQKLEMTIDMTKIPSENVRESVLAWFSTMIGMQEDVVIGTGVLGITVTLVMILIYVIRVRLKAKSNLHFAVKQFVEAELYAEQNPDCKEEMEKVDAHIQDTVGTLKAYQVLLNEQKGKLERILYFEGEKEKGASYRDRSLAEIEETKELVETINSLIEIPIVEDEKISDESIVSLQKAKEKLYTVLKKF